MKSFSFRKSLLTALAILMTVICTGCTSADDNNIFSEEDALTIAENGFKAMKEKDSAGMVEYINMDIFYYAANQKHISKEELINTIDSLIAESSDTYNSMGIIGIVAALKNVKFYDVQPFPAEEINKLNEFIINEGLLGEAGTFDYTIEKAYKLKVSYDGVEEENFEEGNEPYVLVVYANNEWKLDMCVSIMKELYDSFNQLYMN